ncbi:DJ-1/PfpI family protein [Nocardia cyriacigeorgica]|uniref:DJ-1/PfpI family protein n=3 Tax=Nocardia cyriacigeorgica TaxID=135487 RepID=UPI000CEA07E3|nr:DJ-1/PfpI family protein [Nocardia cyriacigeorgica]AVH23095.1 AraC family transcriptional regulator [Nocardia cyriacigeorgica]PPJ16799.1 AraC family transcriptional regulator [Nocardia cyriacigeorgica]
MNRRTVLRAGVGAATGAGFLAMPTAQPSPTRRRRADPAPWRVQILVFDGVDDLDIFAPLEVLGYATHFDSRAQVELVTAADPGSVVLMSGTAIDVRSGWAPHRAEVIVVPGGGYGLPPGAPGVPTEISRGHLPRLLAAARRDGLTMASVCVGAMLLSAAGLTRGRPCTTHHRLAGQLEREGGLITRARVVDDGDLVTTGGVTSGLDLALWLVQRELGSATALAVEEVMEYERRGTVWTRERA